MAISIEQIKELRDATGVSMTACKKALEDGGGDFEKAVDVLRKKGEAKAVDRAGKSTSQGVVVVKSDGKKTAMVSLQCETDFVSKGDDFLVLAEKMANKLLKGEIKPVDRDIPEIKDAVLKMGENICIGDMALYEGDNVGSYVHSNRKIGVLVSLRGGTLEVARDIAMQVAATNPKVIDPEQVSEELVAKEKEIWTEQLKGESKPDEIIQKILFGKEKKFREENALIKQAFVKDPEKIVEQLLKSDGSSIIDFVRFSV